MCLYLVDDKKQELFLRKHLEKSRLDAADAFDYSCLCRLQERHLLGSVAQLGARLVRIEEVRGSNPLRSTTNINLLALRVGRFLFFRPFSTNA